MKIVMSIEDVDTFDRVRMNITEFGDMLVKEKTKAAAIAALTEKIDERIEELNEARKSLQEL